MSIHRQQIRSAMTATAAEHLTGAQAAALVSGDLWQHLFSFPIDGTSMPVLLWPGHAPIIITRHGLVLATLRDEERGTSWGVAPAYRRRFDHGSIAEAKAAAGEEGARLAPVVTDWKAMGFNLGQGGEPPPLAGRVFVTPNPTPTPTPLDQRHADRAESLNRLEYDAKTSDPLRVIAGALVHLARYGVPTWKD